MPTKLRYLYDPDPWMLAEDIPDMDAFIAQIWQSAFVNEFIRPAGVRYRKVLSIHRGYHLWFYYGEQDSKRVGDYIAEKIVRTPTFAVRVNREIVRWSDRLRKFGDRIPEEHLSRLSNRELWSWYGRHDAIHTDYYRWGWIPVAADMFHNNLTERLKQFLRLEVEEAKVNEYLVALTQPCKKSLIQIEQEQLLQVAEKAYRNPRQRGVFLEFSRWMKEREAAQYGLKTHTPEYERLLEERVGSIRDRIAPGIIKAVEQHYRRYHSIKHMWIGKDGVYSFDYYLKELVKLVASGPNPNVLLARMRREFAQQIAKRRALIQRLRIRNPWRTVLDAWGDFMVTKIYRRYAQIYAIYRMQPILQEIARRLMLSLFDVRMMLKEEIRTALLIGRVDRRNLRARSRLVVFYYEQGREIAFTGRRAQVIARAAERQLHHQAAEIHGQVGCVGRAVGTVKIIIRPDDMRKMKTGDILVSIATDPDIVPAMKKASAIVTEQGGVTSHAAIVSRELKIPCVIGTKIATKWLKDGDRVEVDAYKGIVRKV